MRNNPSAPLVSGSDEYSDYDTKYRPGTYLQKRSAFDSGYSGPEQKYTSREGLSEGGE